MKQAPETLINLIEPVVEGLGYECVGIEYHPSAHHGLLRIYIDHPQGILLEDCSKVSHQISGVLDVEDPISGQYQLEISSPGEKRPLFKLSQFQQFIGRMVNMQFTQMYQQRRKMTGLIHAVHAETIVIAIAEQLFEVPFALIQKARLVAEYELKKEGQSGK
ncbi:MAG: hypothetical protein RL637_1323 [Pseudomonadota bacterium]|jgi:ribosome maturation factor RimP